MNPTPHHAIAATAAEEIITALRPDISHREVTAIITRAIAAAVAAELANERADDDTKRLDWLEKSYFTAYRHRDPDPDHESKHPAHCVVVDESRPRKGCVSHSIRKAIDEAMRPTPAGAKEKL